MARLIGKLGIVDRAAAMNASTEAFHDNRFVGRLRAARLKRPAVIHLFEPNPDLSLPP